MRANASATANRTSSGSTSDDDIRVSAKTATAFGLRFGDRVSDRGIDSTSGNLAVRLVYQDSQVDAPRHK